MTAGRLPYLRDTLGFDLSKRSGRYLRVACSQCAACTVNGIALHERTCPNETHECDGCNERIPMRARYCQDCAT